MRSANIIVLTKNILFNIIPYSCLLLSCSEKPPKVPLYNHHRSFGDSIISQFNPRGEDRAALNFCQIFDFSWDSLIVVPPYSEYGQVKELGLENLSSLKSELSSLAYRDDVITFLFTVKNKVVRCDQSPNVPVYFTSMLDLTTANFPIIKRKDCMKLYLKKVRSSGDSSYSITY